MRATLDTQTLDQISGGYLRGTIDGSNFVLKQNDQGQYLMQIQGQNTQVFNEDQLKKYLQDTAGKHRPISDNRMKKIIQQIGSSKGYNAGDWDTTNNA